MFTSAFSAIILLTASTPHPLWPAPMPMPNGADTAHVHPSDLRAADAAPVAATPTGRGDSAGTGDGGYRDDPCADATYDNGAYDGRSAIAAQRSAPDWIDAAVVDDVALLQDAVLATCTWVAIAQGFDFNGTADLVLLNPDGPDGAPGSIVADRPGLPAVQSDTGELLFGMPVLQYTLTELHLPVPAGPYFFGVRPVTDESHGQSWWPTAALTGSDAYFRSAFFGFPDWAPAAELLGAPTNVAFCFTTETGPQPGACCLEFTCAIGDQGACHEQGGAYLGDGSLCGENTCGTPDTTLEPGSNHTPTGAPCNCTSCGKGSEMELADPVYQFSGEFYDDLVDLRIPGRGLDFIWARKYRSRVGPDTVIGNGWDFSYNVGIEANGPHVALYDGHSRRDTYFQRPDGTWTRSEFFRVIARNLDGSYTVSFPDTGIWILQALDGSPTAGRLTAAQDRNGNTLKFEYDGLGRLIRVLDTLERAITLAYNADGYLDTLTDFTGRQVRYAYYHDGDAGGSAGDLKSVTTPAVTGTPTGNDFPDGKTTVYTYSQGYGDERLNHNLLTITDAKGQTFLTNLYADTTDPSDPLFDHIVRQVWGDAGDLLDFDYYAQTPDESNNYAVIKTILNDRMGNVKEYFYDAGNRLVLLREYTGRADPDQPTTETDNRPTGKLRGDDPDYFETRVDFNADSQRTRIVHPNGNEETYVYDEGNSGRRSQGNLLEHCWLPGTLGGDQAQICEQFEYDDTIGGCCGSSFVTRHVDGRGSETRHEYDARGNRVRTTHRIPTIIEEWEYNAFGQLTAHVLPDNGSGHRRRDENTYYDSGTQRGYRASAIVDAGGLALTTTDEYDAVGNVIRRTDARGHDTQFDVNALSQVVRTISREVTDGSGVRYERDTYYDANNNVVRVDVQNIDDQGALGANTHFSTIYEYETLNRPIRVTVEVDAGHSVVTEYEYDANRNRTATRYGESTNGNQPANMVALAYDERDLLFRETRAAGDPARTTTQYDYDGNSHRRRVTRGLEDRPEGMTYAYDGYDRLVRVIDANGNRETYHYDANHNRTSLRIDGELNDVPGDAGNVRLRETTFKYDALDRLVRRDDAFFDPATQTPLNDGQATTQLFYSDTSQLIRRVDDNGHATLSAYDTANRLSARTDAVGNRTVFEYDANANLVAVTSIEKSDLGGPDESYRLEHTFDNLDRRIATVDNAGNTVALAYDSRDNSTRALDALGRETRYEYDGLNRLMRTIQDMDGDGADAGDPADLVLAQTFDDSSRVTERRDTNGNATRYTYDALDRAVRVTFADETSEAHTYDVHDNLIEALDANGTRVRYSYDLRNRPIRKDVTPGPGVADDTTLETFAYDGRDELMRIESDGSVVTYAYDSLGHRISETLDGATTSSTYDGCGHRLTCTYPGGRKLEYVYDARDRLVQIADADGTIATQSYIGPRRLARRDLGNATRTEYVYDGLANPPGDYGVQQITRTQHTHIGDGAVLDDHAYAWDPAGNATLRQDVRPGGSGRQHAYSYDAADRLIRTLEQDDHGNTVRDTGYELDSAGNRLSVTGDKYAGSYACDATLPEPADCQMDQYTTTPFDARTTDARGNVSASGQCLPGDSNCSGTIDFDDIDCFVAALIGGEAGWADCLHRVGCDTYLCGNDLNDDGDVNFDDIDPFVDTLINGHAPRTTSGGHYDYANRVVSFVDRGTGRAHQYAYDALGRRVRKTVDATGGGPVTRYLYDGAHLIEEQDGDGATLATYVYGTGVDDLIQMRRGGSDYYYHADHLGSTVAVSDAAGEVVERYEYGDYGRPEVLVDTTDFAVLPADWRVFGAAAHVADPGVVRLVPSGQQFVAGSAFLDRPIPADDFEVSFDFQLTNVAGDFPDGAGQVDPDGLTVVFAEAPAAPVFVEGYGLGYFKWPGKSFAVEFDCFQNKFDPDSNHVGIDLRGGVTHSAGITRPVAPDFDETGRWHAVVRYRDGKLSVRVTPPGGAEFYVIESFTLPTNAIPDNIYVGFTSATGLNSADTDIDNVRISLPGGSAIGNRLLFTGREYDGESGLYYYRTRYLDPRAGRFTSRDPAGLWRDAANLGNPLAYVGNNPASFRDPDGRKTVTATVDEDRSEFLDGGTPDFAITVFLSGEKKGPKPCCTLENVSGDVLIGFDEGSGKGSAELEKEGFKVEGNIEYSSEYVVTWKVTEFTKTGKCAKLGVAFAVSDTDKWKASLGASVKGTGGKIGFESVSKSGFEGNITLTLCCDSSNTAAQVIISGVGTAQSEPWDGGTGNKREPKKDKKDELNSKWDAESFVDFTTGTSAGNLHPTK